MGQTTMKLLGNRTRTFRSRHVLCCYCSQDYEEFKKTLLVCENCGRRFAADRLEVHQRSCKAKPKRRVSTLQTSQIPVSLNSSLNLSGVARQWLLKNLGRLCPSESTASTQRPAEINSNTFLNGRLLRLYHQRFRAFGPCLTALRVYYAGGWWFLGSWLFNNDFLPNGCRFRQQDQPQMWSKWSPTLLLGCRDPYGLKVFLKKTDFILLNGCSF